jgi:radical SAM protein with 4Fe4S-binding SPASM domain
MAYSPRFLDATMLQERIGEMGRLGLKSIMFGGEGEPLLHRNISNIIRHTRQSGIDVAVTTNGVFLTRELMEQIATSTSWIKVSLNAGSASTYAAIHRCRENDFETVLGNISAAADEKARLNGACVIGIQAILLPENMHEMEILAERAKNAGADYLVIKSYSQHSYSITRHDADIDYEAACRLSEQLQNFADQNFKVIVRLNAMQKLRQQERGYERCQALPFWSYIDAGGNVWGCSAFLGDERFRYGSLYEESFEKIWHGERRHRSLEMVAQQLDVHECRQNCRMDEVNRYLWELTHPLGHVNFI